MASHRDGANGILDAVPVHHKLLIILPFQCNAPVNTGRMTRGEWHQQELDITGVYQFVILCMTEDSQPIRMIDPHPVHKGGIAQCSNAIRHEEGLRITGNRVSTEERNERRTEDMECPSVSRAERSSIIKKNGAFDGNAPSCCTSLSISETQVV